MVVNIGKPRSIIVDIGRGLQAFEQRAFVGEQQIRLIRLACFLPSPIGVFLFQTTDAAGYSSGLFRPQGRPVFDTLGMMKKDHEVRSAYGPMGNPKKAKSGLSARQDYRLTNHPLPT